MRDRIGHHQCYLVHPPKGNKTMTKTKSVKEVKLKAAKPVVEPVEPVVEPEEVIPVESLKDRGDNGSFKIEIKPTDSPKVRKAKLIAIFAASKAQNPKLYALKNKDAELERKIKAL